MQGGVGGVGVGGGGGGGGTGAPTAMNQLWGGPACKRLRTPVLYYSSINLMKTVMYKRFNANNFNDTSLQKAS